MAAVELVDILSLEELLNNVLKYCSPKDVRNLSVCNSQYNEAVQPALWRHVSISCDYNTLKKMTYGETVAKLEHTDSLHFKAFDDTRQREVHHMRNRKGTEFF